MPQYFIDEKMESGRVTEINGDDFHHLVHVRRVKTGDGIYLRDNTGTLYAGWVAEISSASVKVEISSQAKYDSTLPRITLGMALLKHGNFEFVIQKSVELGISRIVPLVTSRTISDIRSKEKEKLTRWIRIAEEAAKQSMRADIPEIMPPQKFEDFISMESSVKIITHPGDEGITFREAIAKSEGDAIIAVGPEGGFSPDEIRSAVEKGFVCVNFGETQLRAETAGIVLPAILMYELGLRND